MYEQFMIFFENKELAGVDFHASRLQVVYPLISASLKIEGSVFFRIERLDHESAFFYANKDGACVFEFNDPEYITIYRCDASLANTKYFYVNESSWGLSIAIPSLALSDLASSKEELSNFLENRPPSNPIRFSQRLDDLSSLVVDAD